MKVIIIFKDDCSSDCFMTHVKATFRLMDFGLIYFSEVKYGSKKHKFASFIFTKYVTL